jgi:ferredoxin
MPERIPERCRILITYQGRTEEVEGDPNETILGSVLDHGLPVPFGCQSGTCLACNAVLIEGEVKVGDSPALSQELREKGIILTCSSYPRSSYLWLSYDD